MSYPSKEAVEKFARALAEARFSVYIGRIVPDAERDYDLMAPYERGDLNELARILLNKGFQVPVDKDLAAFDGVDKAFEAAQAIRDMALSEGRLGALREVAHNLNDSESLGIVQEMIAEETETISEMRREQSFEQRNS